MSNPGDTYNTIKTAISESYERDRVNGDANSRAHWVTYALGTVATSIVGTKGTNALVKTGTTAAKASVPRVVSATNHASASLANLLPYTPRPQLAMAGGIPYNVVNGVQLKDQLITMAKAESGVSGVTEKAVTKGTGDFGISKITQNSPQNVILGELDNLGRPTGVTATITQDMIGTGSKASQSIKPPGFLGGGPGSPGHARGHLLGNQLGGPGKDARNLVTLYQTPVNSPVMRDFESSVRVAVEKGEVV